MVIDLKKDSLFMFNNRGKLAAAMLAVILVMCFASCREEQPGPTEYTVEYTEPAVTTQPTTAKPTQAPTTTAPVTTIPPTTVPVETKPPFDPYAEDTEYDVGSDWFENQGDTDYGTLMTDIEYYSSTADDYKRFNILLPPGYDQKKKYPVMYMIHGWGADYTAHVHNGSYLHMLYGNLLREKTTVPMIIVGVDMYTAKQEDKDENDGWHMRYSYDKVVDDIAYDLMPYISEHYAVAVGRLNTAVAGVSEGGARSLCTGFKFPDKFGYIASISPDGNAIVMTDNYNRSYWTVPYFEDGFPVPAEENKPKYLYLAVGSNDPWNISFTESYSNIFSNMGIANHYDYVEGYGHNSEFWGVCMYNFLQRIFK